MSWLLLLNSPPSYLKKIELTLCKTSMKKVKKLSKITWKSTVKKSKKSKNLLMISESKIPNILTNLKPKIKQSSSRLKIRSNSRLKDQTMIYLASLYLSNPQAVKELNLSFPHKSVSKNCQRFYK